MNLALEKTYTLNLSPQNPQPFTAFTLTALTLLKTPNFQQVDGSLAPLFVSEWLRLRF